MHCLKSEALFCAVLALAACKVHHNSAADGRSQLHARHSQLLTLAAAYAADEHGYRVATLDHEDGSVRTDITCAWDATPELPVERDYFLAPPQVQLKLRSTCVCEAASAALQLASAYRITAAPCHSAARRSPCLPSISCFFATYSLEAGDLEQRAAAAGVQHGE